MITDGKIQKLVAMGFSAEQSRQALAASGGDLNEAINILLCSPAGGRQDGGSSTMIQIALSQYSFPEGTSACSSTSLAFAAAFLNDIGHSTGGKDVVTSDWLQAAMFDGIQNYQKLGSREGMPQHKSPEEILRAIPDSFEVRVCGGVRQGILTDEGPLGFKQTLLNCMDISSTGWVALVLTKPPETLTLCLPPKTERNRAENYVLIDSHPRPQLGSNGCYAIFHSSLDALVHSLKLVSSVCINELLGIHH